MCIDIDATKIAQLKQGIIPIYEPGLKELVLRNIKEGRLQFTTDAKEGVQFWTAIFSAVGTPPDKKNHNKADLTYVYEVAKTFAKYLSNYKVFINKSTVPVGTGKKCKEVIQEELKKRGVSSTIITANAKIYENDNVIDPRFKHEDDNIVGFDVVSNPEFLREGTAIKDFMVPDRIVIGVESERAKKVLQEIYKPFECSYVGIMYTDIASAEIIKYAANAFLATKLSFINEIANFAELAGGNIKEISQGIGSDPRIGNKFLHAGIGYGGSCFPKDIKALIETGKEYGYNFKILPQTEAVNTEQKLKVIEKLRQHLPQLQGKHIAIWGLSFKPKTDDIREAPSLEVIQKLQELWVQQISVYDPVCIPLIESIFSSTLHYGDNSYNTLDGADALIILTEWNEFRLIDYTLLKQKMYGNIIIDGRNILDRQEVESEGYIYEGIGK